jgi:hypothetical protein
VWFEHALERQVPELKAALRGGREPGAAGSGAAGSVGMSLHGRPMGELPLGATARSAQGAAASHLPYLLLNSTWVESGDRAIASELAVSVADFPGARDTVGIVGADLSLATAAHNSARFPFVNAIGSVRATPARCRAGAAVDEPAGAERSPCGHVADGGYFDNAGAHTAIDVLRGLRRWLERGDGDGHVALRAWAKARLRPTLLLIHNGTGIRCRPPAGFHQPDAAAIGCVTRADLWAPELPRPGGPLALYADQLGPLVTAVNVTGLGAHRRRADALLCLELGELRRALGLSGGPALRRYPLLADGILYPLGWYLSEQARAGMDRQAERLVPAGSAEPVRHCSG